jgi:hypothetical protein
LISIGGISAPLFKDSNPLLVPKTAFYWLRENNSNIIPEINQLQDTLQTLRWMIQKDKIGQVSRALEISEKFQDMILLGPPGVQRRRVIMQFCDLTNREVEFLTLSRLNYIGNHLTGYM